MPTISSELQDSRVTRITGQDETYAADVGVRSDGKNALAVDAYVSGTILTWTNKLSYVDMNASNGGIARGTSVSTSWTNVFSYTGSGLLAGFLINLETFTLWDVRLVIDGVVIFTLNSDDISGDTVYDLDDITDINQAYLGISKGSHDRVVYTSPLKIPIRYQTSLVIAIKKTSGGTKKFQAGLVVLTKET
jgi:hypothetical protein